MFVYNQSDVRILGGRRAGRNEVAQTVERALGALSAGVLIGNPFTDVADLQSYAVAEGDPGLTRREAVRLAETFWPQRELCWR